MYLNRKHGHWLPVFALLIAAGIITPDVWAAEEPQAEKGLLDNAVPKYPAGTPLRPDGTPIHGAKTSNPNDPSLQPPSPDTLGIPLPPNTYVYSTPPATADAPAPAAASAAPAPASAAPPAPGAKPQPPIGALFPGAEATIAPETLPVAAAPTTPPPIPSLFFSPNEISFIRDAIDNYASHNAAKNAQAPAGNDFLSDITGNTKEVEVQVTATYTYPQFTVDSIVYHNASNWSLWLDNRMVNQESPKPQANLRVVSLDKNEVHLEWTPTTDDLAHQLVQPQNSPNVQVKGNKEAQTVTITMHPNQTFSSYAMQVVEGRPLPMTVQNIKKADEEYKLPDPTAKPAGQNKPNQPQRRKPGGQGLGGLIGKYKQLGTQE